jgi:hypothetical protein
MISDVGVWRNSGGYEFEEAYMEEDNNELFVCRNFMHDGNV